MRRLRRSAELLDRVSTAAECDATGSLQRAGPGTRARGLLHLRSQPGMLRGSLPGAMVSFARTFPSLPWMLSSPPPWFSR